MSTALRPLTLRCRPDLRLARQMFGREAYWLVKDPVAMRYFHLRNEEHALLEMLDGRASLTEIRQQFEARFAPWRLSGEQLYAFVARMHELGLVVSDAPGQGAQLLQRREKQRRRGWLGQITNVLAIRLPGINPAPLLDRLEPACRWIFTPAFALVWTILIALAVGLVAARFAVIEQRLPDFQAFFTWTNIGWLAGAMAGAKIVHELAHAVACRHFGGECRELGLMLLLFTPCLYCNVSDAWTFPSKWRRVAVSAAGIAVELLLAAVATLLWWSSTPGLLNTLCLNLMVVCSVSTLIFNGNPLLRYDGYYVLADLLEVPNLAQQASSLMHRTLARWTLGIDLPPDRWLPRRRRGLLMAYAAAAAIYRAVVLVGVLWIIYHVLARHGLQVVAQGLIFVGLVGAVFVPASGAARWLLRPSRRPPIKSGHAVITLLILLGLLGGFFYVPLPCYVSAPAVLEPRAAQRVYTVVAGRLEHAVTVGQSIRAGDEIARLVNLELHKETVELSGQVRQQEQQLANLRLRQSDPAAAVQIPTVTAALADSRQRLDERERDETRLVLKAPVAGIVLPPPRHSRQQASDELGAWQGSPLDERNQGCYLDEGTLVCLIGSPASLEANLLIDQSDVNLVAPGQAVRLRWDFAPSRVMHGTVEEVAKSDLKLVPAELAQGSDLPVRVDEQGVVRPRTTIYQVRVRLDEPADDLRAAARGRAKISIAEHPLAWRVLRYLRQTFL